MLLTRTICAGALLLGLAACDEPQMASSGGRQTVVDCQATTDASTQVAYRRPGPCWDGTDRTDRRNRDTTQNITRLTVDSTADVTDRRNRDDTTDRSIWCASAGAVITAPSFMVFFDWDKIDLSAQALATIQQAADAYRQKGGAKLTANGHTDTSGSPEYNKALSVRRADAVKAALVRDGVPESDISVVGWGERQLLVQTPDGVREAQNRRVEIVLK